MPVLHATREGAPIHQFTTENPVTGSRYYLRHCMEDHLKRLVPVIPRLFELGKAIRVEVEDLARAEEFLVLEAVAGDVTFEQGCQLVLDVLHDALQRTFGDVRFEAFETMKVVAAGERAADLSVRLLYAGAQHITIDDPMKAIASCPPGRVEVLANYTAFRDLGVALERAEGGRK